MGHELALNRYVSPPFFPFGWRGRLAHGFTVARTHPLSCLTPFFFKNPWGKCEKKKKKKSDWIEEDELDKKEIMSTKVIAVLAALTAVGLAWIRLRKKTKSKTVRVLICTCPFTSLILPYSTTNHTLETSYHTPFLILILYFPIQQPIILPWKHHIIQGHSERKVCNVKNNILVVFGRIGTIRGTDTTR